MHAIIAQLRAGVDALRAGAPQAAIPLLTAVAQDPALAAATDLQDIRARALSLLGQAHLLANDPETALKWISDAIVTLEQVSATEEIAPLLALREEAIQAIQGTKMQPQDHIVSDHKLDPLDPAEHLLRVATMLYESGEKEKALQHAVALLDFPSITPRSEVIARLMISELDPSQAQHQLDTGWARAEAADEFNLVAAIAKRATALNLDVGVLGGPKN
jgi:hypothetical protein